MFVKCICMENVSWVKIIIDAALIVFKVCALTNLMKTADNLKSQNELSRLLWGIRSTIWTNKVEIVSFNALIV